MHNLAKSIVPIRVSKPTKVALLVSTICLYWNYFGYTKSDSKATTSTDIS